MKHGLSRWMAPVWALGLVCDVCAARDRGAALSVIELIHRARVEVGNTNLPAARLLAEQAVAVDPAYADTWKQLGRVLMLQGHPEEALNAIDTALELRPDDRELRRWRPGILRDLGWSHWARGERDRALACFNEALKGALDNREALVRQVFALLAEAGPREEAAAFLKQWTDTQTQAELGYFFFERDRLVAAEIAFDTALTSGARSASVFSRVAFLRALRGACEPLARDLKSWLADNEAFEREEAEFLHESLLLCAMRESGELPQRTAPEPTAALTDRLERLARARLAERDYAQAYRLYARIAARDPNRRCYLRAASAATALRGDAGALEFLSALAERTRDPATRAGILGRLARIRGEADRAVAHYRESLDADPKQADLRYELFSTLISLGRRDEARDQLAWFIERLKHGDSSAQTPLAEMWATLEDYQGALNMWTTLAKQYPSSAYYVVERARVLDRMGRSDEARDSLMDLTRRSEDAQALQLLAEILLRQNRPLDALDAVERGLRIEWSPALLRLRDQALQRATRAPE